MFRYIKDLKQGDFIAIAHNNWIEFGWYIGRGQGNSVQYFTLRSPSIYLEHYEKGTMRVNDSLQKHIEKHGLTTKILYKSFIWGESSQRILKIENPEQMLQGEDLTKYLQSKDALIKLKFLNS